MKEIKQGESDLSGKTVMVLPERAAKLRFSWQGKNSTTGKVIDSIKDGQPVDKYKDLISLFTTDLITPWDDDLAKKVTAFRDMVNLIERLKDALERDWVEFTKDLPRL
jgi:hypothetical protein